ncbi:MAG: amidohydrolase, partial [Patescibacteria group bacterium]|nr:amidohydrolase [Patescibacteria group bacterium]
MVSLSKKIIILSLLATVTIFAVFFFTQDTDNKEYYNAEIIIKNATILTMNEQADVIDDGWIAIKKGKIIGMGNGKHDYTSREVIYAEGKIVMPGLINAHSHTVMTLFRGADDSSKLTDWISNTSVYEKEISEDEAYQGALLGEIEMIQSGTTTFNDMYFFEKALVDSVKKTGMRAVVDIPFSFEKNGLKIDQEFINSNKNFSRISFSIAPNPLINFSKGELDEIKKVISDNNIFLHIHIEEGKDEKSKFIEKYNLTPLQMLAGSDLLTDKIVMAHAVNFTDEEFKIISKYPEIGIALNPKTNFKLSGFTAPITKMLSYNLTLGVGTDGAGSSNSLDLFDQINFIAFAAGKCDSDGDYCENKNNIYPEKIVRMVTIDGAKVLGLDKEIGSLEVGKKADMIFVDFEKVGLVPAYDIYSSLVYNTDGSAVTDSIIDGEIVMRNRKLTNLSEREITKVIKQVNKIAEKI